MAKNAAELVGLRNLFYRDNYRRVVGALLFMILVNVALAGVIFYQFLNPPTPQYFAVSTNGRITPVYPLTEPIWGSAELLQWASRAAVTAYTYNYVNYRLALQKAQNDFTPRGWGYFEDALKSSRMLETVLAKKLVVSAVATGAPVIIDQGVINGRYVWKVQLPLLVTYQSPSELTPVPVTITMIITRVPTVNMPRGIAIASFISAERPLSQQ